MKIEYPLVEVTWVDSENGYHRWTPFAEIDLKEEVPLITTTGYLFHEDKDKMVIVQNIDMKNKKILSRMSIPKMCILDTKKIRNSKIT